MAANQTNPKSELVTFLQRKIGRALTKGDTVYESQQNGECWQCTLKLPCHQGEEFAGELAASEKDAQQSAAAQALALYAAEIAALPPPAPKKKAKKPAQPNAMVMQGALNIGLGGGAATPAQEAENCKTQLMQQMQTHCGRAMTKTDLIYESVKIGDAGFQATLRLACCGGQEFVGEVASDTKAAQQSAAQQALMNSHMWMPGTAEAPAPVDNKRKTPDPSQNNPKSELITFVQRYLGRTLEKNDLLYQSNETVGGTQSTVQLTCYQNRQFAGEVCETQKLAEAAAANQALVALTAELGQQQPGPPSKKKKKTSSGGGQTTPASQQTVAAFQQTLAKFNKFMGGAVMPGMAGFGPCGGAQKGGAQMGGAQMGGAQKGGVQMGGAQKGGAGKPMQMAGKGAQMQQMACGKGQGKAAGAQAASGPRTFIVKEPILGEIESWNEAGGFGWIRPGMVINHPEAQKRQGKIYVARKDVTPGQPIGQGSMVQFRVYTDNKGMGACEVMPF